ncbi:E3 ubiquitin-protein ligase ATL31, partial [Mucuna pruriens]
MRIIILFFLVAPTSFVFCTTYNQSTPPPSVPHGASNKATVGGILPVLLTFFVFAFFITAFCYVYILYCFPQQHELPQTTRTTRGIDPRVLATCPVMSYSAAAKNLKFNAALQCAVCLAEFGDADALRLLPKCGHAFHSACIDAWLASHVTCPVCRGEVSVEIEGEARARHVLDESSVRGFGVLLRSHSTGHSMERLALRLSEEVMKKILEDGERGSVTTMKRSASYDVVLRSWEGGEGSISSKGESNNNNNRWVLSLTPPFVYRGSGSSNVGPASSGIPRMLGFGYAVLFGAMDPIMGLPLRVWNERPIHQRYRGLYCCEERNIIPEEWCDHTGNINL